MWSNKDNLRENSLAVCHYHELHALVTFSFADCKAPFLDRSAVTIDKGFFLVDQRLLHL